MLQRLKSLSPLLVVIVFGLVCYLLSRELRHYTFTQIRDAVWQVPTTTLLLAIGLTALSYFCLVGYDWLAVRAAGLSLPFWKIATASFLGHTTAYNFGAIFGGTSIRYRLYSTWGLKASEILRFVSMLMVNYTVGLLAMGSVAFFLVSGLNTKGPAAIFAHLPNRLIGVAIASVLVAYLVANAVRRKPIHIGHCSIQLPGLKLAIGQVVVASVDLVVVSLVLWVLLPEQLNVSYPVLLSGFLLAILVATFSQIPGGLGVFELTVLSFVAPGAADPQAVGALILYRVIYYFLPLFIATFIWLWHEWRLHREQVSKIHHGVVRNISPLVPRIIGYLTFACGAILMFSSAIPAVKSNLATLEKLLPLSVIESSHLIGSIIGTILLVLSRGLTRRYDSAWLLTTLLVALGIVTSLLKGLSIWEAVLLAMLLVLLITTRKQFYRRGALLHSGISPTWLAGVAMALITMVWLGWFAHKHVQYSHDLWWHFAYDSDATRFMRAAFASAVTLLVLAILGFQKSSKPKLELPGKEDLDLAAEIIAKQDSTEAHLALMGDKYFLFNEQRSAFVMFDVQRSSWIALGDPVGPPEEHIGLLWDYHEMVDLHGGRTVFHHILASHLPNYLQLGMTPLKLGDLARVRLETFSYSGGHSKDQRKARNRYEREGFHFEVIPQENVSEHLPRLRVISDEWLREKNTPEKRFSIGFFTDEYMARFPMAVVVKDGEIYAFANVLETAPKIEVSVDLMRHVTEIPNGIMDYLFSELLLWGKEQGYQHFSFGMAPLTGLESHPLAPLWNRVGNTLFSHGEHFFNFAGLRRFKSKFNPEWEPLYLMCPRNKSVPKILLDFAALNSGGVKSIVSK